MSKPAMRVAVTGAAGQIGYALLFRIASGEMLGKDQPVILQLLEIPDEKAQKALKGVMMELDDCAFPLLESMTAHSDPREAFKDADVALLVGSRPRGPGMERKDLLQMNAKIFTEQGKALNDVASRNVKVLVVGNPANTNAYIAMKSAPDLPAENFTAMLRLDHNRALSQLAEKSGKKVADIEKLIVWGNHSPTMYPDIRFATANGDKLAEVINDDAWNRNTLFLPSVSAAPPSSRHVACLQPHPPPMPPLITCATGCWAQTASGSPWASPQMAPTVFPKASCTASRLPRKTVSTKLLKGWTSIRSHASAWTKP